MKTILLSLCLVLAACECPSSKVAKNIVTEEALIAQVIVKIDSPNPPSGVELALVLKAHHRWLVALTRWATGDPSFRPEIEIENRFD